MKEIPGMRGWLATTCGKILRTMDSLGNTSGRMSKIKREIEEKGYYLVPQANEASGYRGVSYNNGKVGVHRLIAMAFLANENNLPIVNHKDENKSNNCVSNLEWCTHSYNLSYSRKKTKCNLNSQE